MAKTDNTPASPEEVEKLLAYVDKVGPPKPDEDISDYSFGEWMDRWIRENNIHPGLCRSPGSWDLYCHFIYWVRDQDGPEFHTWAGTFAREFKRRGFERYALRYPSPRPDGLKDPQVVWRVDKETSFLLGRWAAKTQRPLIGSAKKYVPPWVTAREERQKENEKREREAARIFPKSNPEYSQGPISRAERIRVTRALNLVLSQKAGQVEDMGSFSDGGIWDEGTKG